MWFVVRLRIGPVAASLNRLIDLLWMTVAASHNTNRICVHLDIQLQNNSTFLPLKKHMQKACAHRSKDTHHSFLTNSLDPSSTIWTSSCWYFWIPIENPESYEHSIIQWFNSPYIHHQVYIMDATHYWPFAREYSTWNTTVAALQFWTADLEPHILSDAIEWVYTAFFWSNAVQQLWYQPEERIFGHFVTILNDTFEWEFTQEDEVYESGSESLNIPTPLRRALQIYHVSMSENLPFNLPHCLPQLNNT